MAEQIEQSKMDEIDKMVAAVEKGKADIFKPPGNNLAHDTYQIDDEFFMLTAHVDEALIAKIRKGEYVDLAKLLPKEKILHDDGRLQMVNKEGQSFLQPLAEKLPPMITNVRKGEHAFSIYGTIYAEANPGRATEIFKHIHNIRTAANTYMWDNVYNYDVTFHRIIGKYPWRNWGGIICHQGWSPGFLKEKIDKSSRFEFGGKHKNGKSGGPPYAGDSTKGSAVMALTVILIMLYSRVLPIVQYGNKYLTGSSFVGL